MKAGSLALLNLTLGQFLISHSSQKRNSIQNLISVACDKYISILLLGRGVVVVVTNKAKVETRVFNIRVRVLLKRAHHFSQNLLPKPLYNEKKTISNSGTGRESTLVRYSIPVSECDPAVPVTATLLLQSEGLLGRNIIFCYRLL